MEQNITFAIITCSDTRGMKEDTAGAALETLIAENGWECKSHVVVPDERPFIASAIVRACDEQDVDVVLTTREIVRMFRGEQINPAVLDEMPFDSPLGSGTGAAVIFGATGGVMEAALRTAADTLTGKSLDSIDYEEVRGTDGIKEAVYNVAGMDVKVAVASGLSNANEILKKVKNGEADYHFIEIMCCPGGCVNGGGMPIQPSSVRNFVDIRKERAKVLYEEDKNLPLRKSHDNPVVKKCYAEYLGEPGSHKAHEILHTTYTPRPKMK